MANSFLLPTIHNSPLIHSWDHTVQDIRLTCPITLLNNSKHIQMCSNRTNSSPMPPYHKGQQQQQPQQQLYSNPQQLQQQMLATQYAAAWGYPQQRLQVPPSHAHAATKVAETATPFEQQQLIVVPEVPITLAEATSRINFDSIQKLSLLFVSVATLAYCAVSPRNLQPLSEYNRHFYDNLRLVALCTIVPMTNFLLVCDARENDINSVITSFYTSFTVGYALAFVLEILMTTAVRLGVFVIWERNIFKLSPKVPTLVLPWVLRESKYRPKRITLFAADFLSSCVSSPIIEEYVKLKILQLSVRLPRNFHWLTKASATGKNSKKKRKRRVAEAASKNPGDQDVTNINSYVTHMLAVSLGMKLCDSSRRILMYTKKGHSNKSLYAFLRGAFPIQELCGTMTALALAKRDVLGVNMAQWQMLVPAVLIHGMANLRGMKPLFKWNSATPWSEMQLSPWNAADDSTLPQLINKGFAKLMWLVLLGRVLGYCIKNYYLVSRQARKRTTTYAGKQAAFSAELAAAEMLKKTKDKK
ncbi:STAS domain containing protein [Fragilaria crotonensis]|nr:STAS domain containing protein [Fragilaria crotonensis]